MELIQHIQVVEASTRDGYERQLSGAISELQEAGYTVEIQTMVPQVALARYSALLIARGV
jgi:menaquinone-dependent protoporphyrinogen IX oxidase